MEPTRRRGQAARGSFGTLDRLGSTMHRMEQAQAKTIEWQAGVATGLPVLVMVYAPVLASMTHAVCVVLIAACVLLFVIGAWLSHALFGTTRTFVPFGTAVIVVLLTWLWQWLAYAALVPSSGLPNGYSLTPQGSHAKLWVLTAPYWTGVASLGLCCSIAVLAWWRKGARRSLFRMVPWWIAVFVMFSAPSVFVSLDFQGNAYIGV